MKKTVQPHIAAMNHTKISSSVYLLTQAKHITEQQRNRKNRIALRALLALGKDQKLTPTPIAPKEMVPLVDEIHRRLGAIQKGTDKTKHKSKGDAQ